MNIKTIFTKICHCEESSSGHKVRPINDWFCPDDHIHLVILVLFNGCPGFLLLLIFFFD
jgi:hypothetical protein